MVLRLFPVPSSPTAEPGSCQAGVVMSGTGAVARRIDAAFSGVLNGYGRHLHVGRGML
ncbi:MAG: hypothetical protein LBE84_09935 [Planctomycetota bacterium]|nr:hypothetical protein [Planctomycetota bacterium]